MPSPTVGQPDVISVLFQTAAGTPYDPPFTTVKVLYSGPGVPTTNKAWPADAVVVKDNPGAYHLVTPDTSDGIWIFRWEGYDAQSNLLAAFDGSMYISASPFRPPPAGSIYPFGTGYATINDVAARVSAGSWDPNKPNQYPTSVQVAQLLIEASAMVDMVLAKAGYTVPLVASPGAPGGIIQPQVYTFLRNVTAALGTAHVELTRHGSGAKNADKISTEWMQLADDLLARLETGEDNLTIFGVAGGFEFEADPAHIISTGNDIFDPTTDTLIGRDGVSGIQTITMKTKF